MFDFREVDCDRQIVVVQIGSRAALADAGLRVVGRIGFVVDDLNRAKTGQVKHVSNPATGVIGRVDNIFFVLFAADHMNLGGPVTRGVYAELIVACFACGGIARADGNVVIQGSAVQSIRASTAIQRVVAFSAQECVIACAPVQEVIFAATVDQVVPRTTIDGITSTIAVDGVVAIRDQVSTAIGRQVAVVVPLTHVFAGIFAVHSPVRALIL